MTTVAVNMTTLADRRSTIRNIVVYFALTFALIATNGTLGRPSTV